MDTENVGFVFENISRRVFLKLDFFQHDKAEHWNA